jgi:hypothetical protein
VAFLRRTLSKGFWAQSCNYTFTIALRFDKHALFDDTAYRVRGDDVNLLDQGRFFRWRREVGTLLRRGYVASQYLDDRFHEIGSHGTDGLFADSSFAVS